MKSPVPFLVSLSLLLLVSASGLENLVSGVGYSPVAGFFAGFKRKQQTNTFDPNLHQSIMHSDLDAISNPCCVSQEPGRVDCFYADRESKIVQAWKLSDTNGYQIVNLGGIALDDVGCVSRGAGYLDVFVLGADNQLNVKSYDGSWSDWISIEGKILETPSCVARSSSRIDCMVRGQQNNALYIGSVDGIWGEYEDRKGVLSYPAAVSKRSEEIVDFWHVGGYVLYLASLTDGWSKWKYLQGKYKGRPEAVSWDSNRIDVFAVGMNNDLMHRAFDGKKWGKWEDVGGQYEKTPTCLTTGVGQIHCFGSGKGAKLTRVSYINGEWTEHYEGTLSVWPTPSCVQTNEKEVTCMSGMALRYMLETIYVFD